MFGRRSPRAPDDLAGDALAAALRAHLPGADPETHRIVTAIAGLLGGVAYADRDFSSTEEASVRAQLIRIQGLAPSGVDAVMTALRANLLMIATVQTPRYCRALVELGDRELRLEVLGMLIALAATDDAISHDEVALLRTTTQALGLEQADYNALQAVHRTKIAALR